MKTKNLSIFIIIYLLIQVPFFTEEEVFENYIVIYGEGPYGQHPLNFDVKNYTEADAQRIAKEEIATYMSGMIYGYTVEYQVENPVNKRNEYFLLKPVYSLKLNDSHFSFRQYERSKVSIRLQGLYRLYDDQKNFTRGFRTSSAVTAYGASEELSSQDWDNRYLSFENAVKNAILNYAKSELKSRPMSLKGRVLLKESPKFSIISGVWRVKVTIDLIINEIKYQDSF